VGEAARLFVDAGLIVLTAFISPFRSERGMARELVGEGEFLEVFVDTPIEVCMQRDPKGLYEKVKAGKIKNFTGIDSPYEAPQRADLTIKTVEVSPEDHAQAIVKHLRDKGYLG
jgi:adenylyl-sulfate kinase